MLSYTRWRPDLTSFSGRKQDVDVYPGSYRILVKRNIALKSCKNQILATLMHISASKRVLGRNSPVFVCNFLGRVYESIWSLGEDRELPTGCATSFNTSVGLA